MKRIYDSWDRAYKSVFGALRRNEPCTFTVCLPETEQPEEKQGNNQK